MKTSLPIFIDAEPLGSTCTIVYHQFIRNGLTPDLPTAKAMLAGIISDTVILKSPTTTAVDILSAKQLSEICGVSVEDFGTEMFSHMSNLKNLDPDIAIKSDFKSYKERGVKVGISQCEVTTLVNYEEYADIYLKALNNLKMRYGLDWAMVMITDVLKEHSILLSTEYKAVNTCLIRS